MARKSALALVIGLFTAACSGACGSGSSGTGGGATTHTTTTGATTTGTASTTSTSTATAKPGKPNLESVVAAVPKMGPGLKVTWSEATPCDTFEGERQTMIDPYPSQATPPGAPQFSVPGTTKTYLDMAPAQNFFFTYHVRCVVAGVASDWSNEMAGNPLQ